ncbi:MAG: WD40 repeat domain-containing protein [Alphaproteobacteria bacterium]|nr:WD40 repeat domain-containing protein [Alphaproteobacteria bacterium]
MAKPKITAGHLWHFDAPVVAIAFDAEGNGAFALGDGTLRMFGAQDAETKTIEAHQGAILCLTAHPEQGFLTGGDDGRLVHTRVGEPPRELFAHKGRWVESVAATSETGLIACTVGKVAHVFSGNERMSFTHASTASGVAFDPKGRRLAVAHYNGASLWWTKSADQQAKTLEWKGSHIAVTWSHDGRFLVTSMQENALHGWRVEDAADMRMSGYPAKIKSVAWDRRGRTLFTAGADRVVGWPFTGRNGPMGREPLQIGPSREALVQVVAAHPEQDIVAAGTTDGAVWFEEIADPGTNFVMLNAAKIVALAFNPQGTHLAIGDEEGNAAVVPVV